MRAGATEPEPEASADAGVADELPESLRLLDLVGLDEDPYKEDGPWAYADEKETGNSSRCFFITTNVMHPSGRLLLSEDRIRKARDRRPNDRHAYVLHDKDVHSAQDAETIPSAVEGEPKADGWHIAEERKSAATIGQVARAYGVPPSCVEVKPLGAFLDVAGQEVVDAGLGLGLARTGCPWVAMMSSDQATLRAAREGARPLCLTVMRRCRSKAAADWSSAVGTVRSRTSQPRWASRAPVRRNG